jgi:hypothetical protein
MVKELRVSSNVGKKSIKLHQTSSLLQYLIVNIAILLCNLGLVILMNKHLWEVICKLK